MQNLLVNPSFEEAWDDWDAHRQIPYGWDLWWAEGGSHENPIDSNPWAEFVAPKIQHKLRKDLPPADAATFILDGDVVLKIFLDSHSWLAGIRQKVWLEPALYEFKPQIFADLVKGYKHGKKQWADDPDKNDGILYWTLNGHRYDKEGQEYKLTPGEWNTPSFEFAASGITEIGCDIMCPFPLKENGIFCDAWRLTKVSSGGRYYVDHHTIILPATATRDHAHALVDMLYDELGGT